MFKVIPGNGDYKISLTGIVVDNTGAVCTLPGRGSLVQIEMYWKLRTVELDWLAMLAHYEVHFPAALCERTFDIRFVHGASSLRGYACNKSMVVSPPVMLNSEYRIVPNYPNYAVTCSGKIVTVLDGSVPYVNAPKSEGYYPTAEVYDPDRGTVRAIGLHRLVAMAWVPNTEPGGRPIANHKDGNKLNTYYKNLEWVTYAANMEHAITSGLRSDNVTCKVFDIQTQETLILHSIGAVCRYIGLNNHRSQAILNVCARGHLIRDRYEVKLSTDDTPWHHQGLSNAIKVGRYVITVTTPEGATTVYRDARDFQAALKLWNTGNVQAMCDKAYALYPDIVIDVQDSMLTGAVQAKCLITGEVLEFSTVRALARQLSVTKTLVRHALRTGVTRPGHTHAFRYKSNEPWVIGPVVTTGESVCILATNLNSDSPIRFESLRKAAAYFSIDKVTIKRHVESGRPYKGWVFKKS